MLRSSRLLQPAMPLKLAYEINMVKILIPAILSLPRILKRLIVLILDGVLSAFSVWLAFYLRTGEWLSFFDNGEWSPSKNLLFVLLIGIPVLIFGGLYKEIFRYSGSVALIRLFKVMCVYTFLFISVFTFYGIPGVPRTIGIIQPILLMVMIVISRLIASHWLNRTYLRRIRGNLVPRVLIYGAGEAGRQLAASLHHNLNMRVAGFIDDDPNKVGSSIEGLKIFNPKDIKDLVISMGVTKILFAIPSANRNRRNQILQKITDAKVEVLTLPGVNDILSGKISVDELISFDIEDLLGRDMVAPDVNLMKMVIRSKIILVTGAAGSIGGELCRQIIKHLPAVLICLDQNEEGLYGLMEDLESQELSPSREEIKIIQVLASVNSETELRWVFSKYRPDIVYHAAAYKHVPIVEKNPLVGAKNNILGTLNIAKLVTEFGVPRMTLISTDKAVRPKNVMGATKRVSEMILQGLAESKPKTIFSMVRFGNVLNSSGSVVPKFRKQIQNGGPITITDYRVTRYFMTIPEAAQLVIQASALAIGGDVFLLEMGEPIKIIDLAIKMIELSGLDVKTDINPDGDIEIREIGLRPGEKLFEELLIAGAPDRTSHPRIYRSNEEFLAWDLLQQKIILIDHAIKSSNNNLLTSILEDLVYGYKAFKSNDL